MIKVRIETLGCRLNQLESEAIATSFKNNNYEISMESVSAKTVGDEQTLICVLNTCTVTQKSEQKARRIIRLQLKKFPKSVVIVTGCYAQVAKDEIEKIDPRICVVPGLVKSRILNLADVTNEYFKSHPDTADFSSFDFINFINEKLFNAPVLKNDFPEAAFKLYTDKFNAHSRASLKIQDGCNNNCSYCAIHKARGHSVSIDVETATQRVIELENQGQSEVVITTVNIGQYKSEYNGEIYNFAKLLNHLLKNTSKINFRISSLYPEIVDDEFCEVIKNDRVRPHFHISVQSGSDKILKLMNRNYVANDVLVACKRLKIAKKSPFIACDIITGFPGETDEDFELTLKLCKDSGFTWIHAFPYSERPGTDAVKLPNKVPQSISGERAKRLTEFAINSKIEYINSFKGNILSAILETEKKPLLASSGNNSVIYHAMTENFIHCEILSLKKMELNKTVQLRILDSLPGRIIKGGEIEAAAEFI